MAIIGAKNWQEEYYTQTNNAVEQLLARYGAKTHLVSCGPTAAVNCIRALGIEPKATTTAGWELQPEDALMLWFHDKRNWKKLTNIRPETSPEFTEYSPNEIPQYYPLAVREVFGVQGTFRWIADFKVLADFVAAGVPAQISIKPGHFLALLAYDTDTKEIIYNDPLSSRGKHLRMGEDMYIQKAKPFAITYRLGGRKNV